MKESSQKQAGECAISPDKLKTILNKMRPSEHLDAPLLVSRQAFILCNKCWKKTWCTCKSCCVWLMIAIKKARPLWGDIIFHHDYARRCASVIDAFILEETLYWWLHPIERVQAVRGIDAWDGYHWTLTRQMAQRRGWVSLKAYMYTMDDVCLDRGNDDTTKQ